MPRCAKIKENLTAWIDQELPPGWAERVEQHLARCSGCAGEARALRESVAAQGPMLSQLMAVDPVDADDLFASVRRSLASGKDEPAVPWWRDWSWLGVLRPLPLAMAAAALLVIAVVEVAGGPEDVLVPIGVKAPPPAVSHKPGMFRDYAIIEQLDALENFDTVDVEPLEEDSAENG